MEQIKHKTLPFKDTIQVKNIIGTKVLTNDGNAIGKVRAIHVHPQELTIEGIQVDTGWFEIDQYIDTNYIQSMTGDAVVLKMTPVTKLVGLNVYDALGKDIGKVINVHRSRMTNKLLSVTVQYGETGEELVITADYIATTGHAVMLKEPFKI
jgi:sporulation protein YlmC with PRC-barrel domain